MRLSKTYEPNQYEPTIYELWEVSGAFSPVDNPHKKPFGIVMPPPNANGALHAGHALTIAVEDVLVRYHRMQGHPTAYLPGADHAGFETWVVFEKELAAKGQSRFDFNRDELYQQVWNYVAAHRGNMEVQLRSLGASCDWSNLTFTLDKKVIDTAYDTFKRMWNDDLIYRGERIVNFCTTHGTSFSDIEVVYKDEASYLWHLAYPLTEGEGEIVVATSRPETMLGDTAVAVHPDDKRYKKLIGQEVHLPLTNRTIPIVADTAVDPAFGTGAVKVTPAHDPTDFEIGERHNLPLIQVIGFDGLTTAEVPAQFQKLSATSARQAVVSQLEEQGVIRDRTELEHAVGHCYKCDTVIEPMAKAQWFVRTGPLAARAIKAIENGDIRFFPSSKRKVLLNYFGELRDWNISRQIAWGIPIPAFQNVKDESDWIFDHRVDQPTIEIEGKTYRRDPDVFDTWFSSGQWPFMCTDYLAKGELSQFYPNSIMETAADILFQWVARMIMFGLYRTGQVPFKDVYLHGLVLDEHGQKMSKSKGNVVNPQEAIDRYGSDALRLGLLMGRSPGQNQAFGTDKIIAARNFCNKLWNIARFIEDKIGKDKPSAVPTPETIADHWILSRLAVATADIERNLKAYRLAEAADAMYHLVWDDVADWYLETSKASPTPAVLAYTLQTILKLAHPFAPFVTETIWQTLQWDPGLLITTPWPQAAAFDKSKAAAFGDLMSLARTIRLMQAELGQRGQKLTHANDPLLTKAALLVEHLARVELHASNEPSGLRVPHATLVTWLAVSGKDVDTYHQRQQARLDGLKATVGQLETRLQNKDYTAKAPAAVVQETKEQLARAREVMEQLRAEVGER